MTTNNIKYVLLLATVAILSFSSCDEDSFSQVATIELPEHEPRPVTRLRIEADQERTLSTLISNSKGLLDPESAYDVPEDAEVNLMRNGSLFSPMEYFAESGEYVASLDNPFPGTAGDTYLLEADIPGFERIRVEQVMPAEPIIEDATYEREGTIDPSGFRVDELVVDVVDPEPGEINYYALGLYQTSFYVDPSTNDTTYYRNRVGIDTNDPLLSYGSTYSLIFTDEGFSGGKYRARCYTYYFVEQEGDVEAIVYQLTEDAFLYERSLNQYYNAIDNPFAEPVTVHSNVPGGYGVFTLANRTVFPIQ